MAHAVRLPRVRDYHLFALRVRPADAYASQGGRWGARRDTERVHLAVDLEQPAGTWLLAPWEKTRYLRGGICYPDDHTYRYVVLVPGWVDPEEEYLRFLYVRPVAGVQRGQLLRQGVHVGTVQDLARRYPRRPPKHRDKIRNHVHVDRWVRRRGVWQRVDPWPRLRRAA